MKFSFKIFFSKCEQIQFPADMLIFTKEVFKEKWHQEFTQDSAQVNKNGNMKTPSSDHISNTAKKRQAPYNFFEETDSFMGNGQ